MRPLPLALFVLVTLGGALLCVVPLFNLVGYESAAAMGVLVGLSAFALSLHALKVGDVPDPVAAGRGGSPAADFFWLLPRSVALSLPPLLLLSLNALRVKNCDAGMGAEFWLLIPVMSALMGQGVAWGAAALARSPAIRLLLGLGVFGFDLLHFALRLATEPPITGHNLLFGWFAGSIYDEALSVPAHLWWYRLMGLGAVACVVAATELAWRHRSGRPRRGAASALVLLLLGTGWLVGTQTRHGINLDRADVIDALGATVKTEHFIIHYDPAAIQGDRLDRLIEDHEFRYAEMQAFLQTDPVAWRGRRLRSFVYPDRGAQQRLMGSRGTLVARPWTHEMHIRWSDYGDNALAHELAHLFTAPFGGGPLQLATRGGLLVDIGLVEGIALAADWPEGELSPHRAAAAMRRLEMAPDLRGIFSPTGFWTQPSGKAYTLMGSFVRWLVDSQGIAAFQQAYRDGDFTAAYGRSAVDLIGEWETYLDEIEVSEADLEQARYLYRRGSIFNKTCARTVAELKRQAQNAQGRRDYGAALDLWRKVRRFAGNTDGDEGLEEAELLVKLDKNEEAVAILDDLLSREGPRHLKPASRARVLELKGDILWTGGDGPLAVEAWDETLNLGIPDGMRRRVEVKVAAASDPRPAVRSIAQAYLLDPNGRRSALYEALSWANEAPGDPLPRYLVGVQLFGAEEHGAVIDTLAGPPGLLPGPHLDEQRRRLLAEALFVARRLDEAEAVLLSLKGSESFRQSAFAAEYLDRIAFLRSLAAAPAASP